MAADNSASIVDHDHQEISWSHREVLPRITPFPGITLQLLTGERMMAAWVTLDSGSIVPPHAHPHEQLGTVLQGELDMMIGGETRRLTPGDTYVIPPQVSHGAVAGTEGCLVLDLFAPPREDYLRLANDRSTATSS